MIGVEGHFPLAKRTRHDVEVIQVVPRWRGHRVEAAWHENAVTAARRKALVERAVGGVHALQGEAAVVAVGEGVAAPPQAAATVTTPSPLRNVRRSSTGVILPLPSGPIGV